MNREGFFKEMGKGLLQTVKTVFEPLIEDDLETLEKTTDTILGIQWLYLCSSEYPFEKLNQFFVKNRSIFVIQEEGNMRAISGICPSCSNLLHLSALLLTCKCFNCEKDFNFRTNSGELTFFDLPITRKQDGYYIGIKTNDDRLSIRNDSNA